jgi:hypothetical protein
MKRKYSTIALLVLISFFSCREKRKKESVVSASSDKTIKENKSKCCTSGIPGRFPIKSSSIKQPGSKN